MVVRSLCCLVATHCWTFLCFPVLLLYLADPVWRRDRLVVWRVVLFYLVCSYGASYISLLSSRRHWLFIFHNENMPI